MKPNTKKIIIEIPNEKVLKLINNTPSLKRLFRGILNIGRNEQNVNHKQYFDIKRMILTIGCNIYEQ